VYLFEKLIKEADSQDLIDNSYMKLLKFYFDKQKFDKVSDLAQDYLKKYPEGLIKAKVFYYLAENSYAQGNFAQAITMHAQALAEHPETELQDLIFQGLGFCYIATNNKLEAKMNIDKIRDKELRLYSQGVYYFKTKSYIEALETFDIFLKTYSESRFRASALLNKADLLYEMGRINDAIYVYNDILIYFREPQYAEIINKAHYGLAWCYLKSGKFTDAIDGFKSTLEDTDSLVVKISSQIQIADTYQETGKYDQALDMYNDVLKNNPNTIYADYVQFQIGVTFLKKKDLENALLALRNLKKNFPNSKLVPQAQYYLAASYFSQEEYAEAKNLLEDFLEKYPKHELTVKSLYLYGKCFYNEGDYVKSLENFNKIQKDFPESEVKEFVYIDIGNVYFNQEDYEQAKKTWKSFLELYPDSEYRPSVMLYLGGLHEKEAEYIEAEKYYLRVADHYSKETWGKEALLSLGHLYWAMGNLDKAEEYFRKLSQGYTPLALKGKLYLAEVLSVKGQYIVAIDIYDQLIKSDSSIAQLALANKANLLKEMKKYHQAVTVYEQAIEKGVDTPDLVFNYGTCLEKVGRNTDAVEAYLKIVYMFSGSKGEQEIEDTQHFKTRSYFRIARIYEKENNFPEAKKIYAKIVESGVKEAKIAEARIKELEELTK
ncbi:MAG: tetratricopeptide repeat protein, partial [Candidatus Omnitrophica bacterium]|nr:tetratricopeptide repeat protein [Candidatus Omnitrophota bacterium]